MIRRPALAAAAPLVLALAVLAAPAPAARAATTCAGQPATLEADAALGQRTATGTEGADVVVARGAVVVDAGGGNDLVCVDGGQVLAGPGDDYVELAPAAGRGGQVDGGTGRDSVGLRGDPASAYALDLRTGVLSSGGAQVGTITSFDETAVFFPTGGGDVTVIGTDRGDDVTVQAARVDVDLGAGRDELGFFVLGSATSTGRLAGGTKGRLQAVSDDSVDLDLAKGRLVATTLSGRSELSVQGFRDADLSARTARFRGDGRDNAVELYGCTVRAVGGGGDDDFRATIRSSSAPLRCSGGPKAIFSGGAGDDVLEGARRNDVLRGGPGRDRLDGRRGVDRCTGGEQLNSCEK